MINDTNTLRRTFEMVVENLVEWAHQAIEKSCNQSVLPHAVIALNKANDNKDDSRWDVNSTTESVLSAANKALGTRILEERVAFWKDRNVEIHTVEDLLKRYYASVTVIRIPMLQHPELLEQQVSKLYSQISEKCRVSYERKRQHHMELDAVKLHMYVRNAFGHFASNPTKPFDFVKASFEINPISPSFGLRNGILRLAVIVQQSIQHQSGLHVWRSVCRVIASCFWLNAHRRSVKGLGKIQIYRSVTSTHIV